MKEEENKKKNNDKKQREKREQSIFLFSNESIEYLGQKLKKQISDDKRPFKIVIKNKIAMFGVPQPLNILENEQIINENEFGKHFIIWAKDEREAKKKAEDFNNQQYNQIWDGLGNIYRTAHNPQFHGLRFYHSVDSISSITILLSSEIKIYIPRKKKQKRNN